MVKDRVVTKKALKASGHNINPLEVDDLILADGKISEKVLKVFNFQKKWDIFNTRIQPGMGKGQGFPGSGMGPGWKIGISGFRDGSGIGLRVPGSQENPECSKLNKKIFNL